VPSPVTGSHPFAASYPSQDAAQPSYAHTEERKKKESTKRRVSNGAEARTALLQIFYSPLRAAVRRVCGPQCIYSEQCHESKRRASEHTVVRSVSSMLQQQQQQQQLSVCTLPSPTVTSWKAVGSSTKATCKQRQSMITNDSERVGRNAF
jgi:hypothetical protein